MLVFSALGSRSGWSVLRYLGRPQRECDAWLVRHVDGMLGAAIAALTAFSVFNADRRRVRTYCVFRTDLGTDSGLTGAPIPA